MSTGTNKERITQNNGIINENNSDLTALKTRINNLPTSGDTTATAGDILQGKTAVSKGVKLTGTYTPSTVSLQSKDITINQNGTTTITADTGYDGLSDVDVTVEGVLDTSDANATAGNIEQGKTAYVKGQKITGELRSVSSISGDGRIIDYPQYNLVQVRSSPGYKTIIQQGGYVDSSISYNIVRNVIGLTADILKKDETVLGVTGTYEGAGIVFTGDATRGLEKSKAISIPKIEFHNVTSIYAFFSQCTSLTNVGALDLTGITNIEYLFDQCSSLVTAPNILFPDARSITGLFYQCTALENVPIYETSYIRLMQSTFRECPNLSNESLNNIMQMCINAINMTQTKTLKLIGLSQTQAETCQTLSNWDAFVAARLVKWLHKLIFTKFNKYVKIKI